MLIVALPVAAPNWKQLRCPSRKIVYHAMEYCKEKRPPKKEQNEQMTATCSTTVSQA